MGIEKFCKAFCRSNIDDNIEINRIYIDANNLMYNSLNTLSSNKENIIIKKINKEPLTKEEESLFDEKVFLEKFIEQFINDVLEILNKYVNLEYIYIAFDGMPEYSKVKMQQHRRFLRILENIYIDKINKDKISDKAKQYIKLKTETEFKTENFAPYTTLSKNMIKKLKNKLDETYGFLNSKELLRKAQNLKDSDLCENIVISSGSEFGEGEKKMIEDIIKHSKEKSIYGLYSNDADVLLLTLLMKGIYNESKFYYIRPSGPKLQRNGQLKNEVEQMDVNDLSDDLYKRIGGNKNKINIIYDIVLIFTLFGNDFVPRVIGIDPSLDNVVDDIINSYIKIGKYIVTKDKNDNFILDINVLKDIFDEISKKEIEYLIDHELDKYDYNRNYGHNLMTYINFHNSLMDIILDKKDFILNFKRIAKKFDDNIDFTKELSENNGNKIFKLLENFFKS